MHAKGLHRGLELTSELPGNKGLKVKSSAMMAPIANMSMGAL